MRPHRRETWDKGRVYTCYKSFLENQEAKKKKKKRKEKTIKVLQRAKLERHGGGINKEASETGSIPMAES
jgi:hypothetical protein